MSSKGSEAIGDAPTAAAGAAPTEAGAVPLAEALLHRLVFRPEALSRNQNFATFNDPEFRRIRDRARHLRSVLTLLRTTPLRNVALRDTKAGWELRVQMPEQSAERMVVLSHDEVSLLATHPTATALRRR